MRYENWDVLIFPDGLKAPAQEFKTQCFVTRDLDSPYLKYHSPTLGSNTLFSHPGNVGQLPILTTFIPSVPKDTPFKISIHSWAKPQPSRFMESLMQPDDILLFEARVFIDGDCVAGGMFAQRATWPYIIELSSLIDRNGNQDVLRFPSFHHDILEQRHWDAGDPYGRIKVVLAEGFSRPNRSPPFERVKDVVALSFQHAPLNILEYSNIAWPNPNMWSRRKPALDYSSMAYSTKHDGSESSHGHTPSKELRVLQPIVGQVARDPHMYNWTGAATRSLVMPMPNWSSCTLESKWDIENDTFLAGKAWEQRGARSSRDDVPMLDYSSSSSRAISSVAGMSFEHSKHASITTPLDDEQYSLILEALTPTKVPLTGTRAPSNTPLIASPSTVIKGRKETEKGKEKDGEKCN